MTLIQLLDIILILIVMPTCMGCMLHRGGERIALTWVKGLISCWAVIFLIAVPCIIKEFSLDAVIKYVGVIAFFLSFAGLALLIVRKKKGEALYSFAKEKLSVNERIYLGLFLGLVLFQLYKTIFYAYEDGDDAFYISVAQAAATSGKMYLNDAYIGIPVTPNFRYALAPFPMWIAAVSRISGVNVAMLSHSIIAPLMVLVTYIIYVEISGELFVEKEKRYMFLALVAIFIMFENVSTSTQGTFLLTRSRQGKEALANVILPFLFLEMYRVIKNECKIRFMDWLIFVVTGIAAALTSMLANILVPLMIFALFIYVIVKKKGFTTYALLASTVIPNLCVALYYARM